MREEVRKATERADNMEAASALLDRASHSHRDDEEAEKYRFGVVEAGEVVNARSTTGAVSLGASLANVPALNGGEAFLVGGYDPSEDPFFGDSAAGASGSVTPRGGFRVEMRRVASATDLMMKRARERAGSKAVPYAPPPIAVPPVKDTVPYAPPPLIDVMTIDKEGKPAAARAQPAKPAAAKPQAAKPIGRKNSFGRKAVRRLTRSLSFDALSRDKPKREEDPADGWV